MSKKGFRHFLKAGAEKFNDFIVPMMAKLVDKPFDGNDWIFEIKWDGYRALAEIEKTDVRLYSRNGLNLQSRFPALVKALSSLKMNAILDGEIVVLDKENRPSFQLLQNYDENSSFPLVYYVFDVLEVNGKSVMNLPLLERKRKLKSILPDYPFVQYCDHIEKNGIAFFESVAENKMEGIIGKRSDSKYYPGKRNGDWVKIKNVQGQEVIICGFTEPSGGRNYFGSLILGMFQDKELTYAGRVGTGFSEKTLHRIFQEMKPLITKKSPFKDRIPDESKSTWLKPELVANIKFAELTESGQFRHPVFLGLRDDKKAKEVHAEIPNRIKENSSKKKIVKKASSPLKKSDKEIKVNGETLKLTHLDKIYFPDDAITKGDVIEYYSSMSKYVLKYLKDRPQSLRRNPNGIVEDGFFQKDAPEQRPNWIVTEPVYSESPDKVIDYIICNNKATLLYMANLGCIELNPWNSRKQNLHKPDWIVMDLDPSDNNTFEQVIEVAQAVKAVLDHAGIKGYPKTSGASGIHVFIPLGAKYSYDETKDFAKTIALLVHELLPEITTLERPLNKRKGRMYLDYLQNRVGQTLASAYSVRPKKGATVSTPLLWEEVKEGLHPSQFTIKNIKERVEKVGDLFSPVLKKGIDLKKAMKKLEELRSEI